MMGTFKGSGSNKGLFISWVSQYTRTTRSSRWSAWTGCWWSSTGTGKWWKSLAAGLHKSSSQLTITLRHSSLSPPPAWITKQFSPSCCFFF